MHVCDHPLSKPGDDLVVVRSPATMRPALWGGAWEGYHIEEFQQKFRTGYPPVHASKALVLHIGMTHGLGGTRPRMGCSWTVGCPARPGLSRLRARLYPLSGCHTGSF